MKILKLSETKLELKQGIDKLVDIVKITLGGKGKNVIIDNGFENVKIINDGVSIAREIEIEDDVMNTGAKLAKQCAEKTNNEGGDGTTTTLVLLQAFLEKMMYVKTRDVRGFRAEIEKVVEDVIKYLDDNKKEIGEGDIYRIAKNSSLDEEIAKTVSDLIKKIGKDGLVSVEDGRTPGISSEVVNGIKIDDGYLHEAMMTDFESKKTIIKDAPILISKKPITSVKDILPIIEELQSKGKNEMLILVDDITNDVMMNLVLTKMKGVFNTCVVKTQNMDDIALVTGAEIITQEKGQNFSIELMGLADKVEVGKHFCQVTGGKEEQSVIDEEIEKLKKQRKDAESEYDAQILSERIAKLQGGVSIIRIAGGNEQQTKERKLKLEDALNSVKSAMDEGIIEGGGMALIRASENIGAENKYEDENRNEAIQLVYEVIRKPFKQILINADENEVRTDGEESTNKGYNVITRQWEDFYETGIIDPVKVVKCALKNAFAMGISIMTAEAGVILKTKK